MGLASPIDLLAVGSKGEVVLLLLALEGENDAALLTRCLAQRAWAAPRLRDWAQLAPELELAPDAPIRVILLAPDFSSETLAAAASLRPGVVQLVRHVSLRVGANPGSSSNRSAATQTPHCPGQPEPGNGSGASCPAHCRAFEAA